MVDTDDESDRRTDSSNDATERSTDSEDESTGTFDNTRRQFVAGGAGAISGLAIGAGFAGPSLAQEDGEDDEGGEGGEDGEDGDEEEDPIENEFEDDIAILNYARTLEFLEARFYREGLENISEEEFAECSALGPEESYLRENALDELRTIQEHEESHVEVLGQTIEELGGEPVEEPAFDFGIRTEFPKVFLATAAQFEDLGVAAYAGAAPFIQNEDLVAPALGIHSTEARHASFLRTLTEQTGFPNVIDEPMGRSEVEAIAGEYIVEGEPPAEDEEDEGDEDDEGGEDGTDGEGGDEGEDGIDGTDGDDGGSGDDGTDGDDGGGDNGTDGDDGGGDDGTDGGGGDDGMDGGGGDDGMDGGDNETSP